MIKNSRIMIFSTQESVCIEMAEYFRESRYNVMWVTEYDELLLLLTDGKHKPDLFIFDMAEASRSEYRVIRQVREYPTIHMVILSEDDRLDSQLYAYSMGIDDYMIKPVQLPLLEAHVEAILRRDSKHSLSVTTIGDISVDRESQRIVLAGEAMDLTAKEYDLMSYFIEHSGMVLSRDKILDAVWGYDYVGGYRSVDTLVKKLRAKLTKKYPYIRTIYGTGYCFDA